MTKKDSSSSDAIKFPVANQYFNQHKNMDDFAKVMNMWHYAVFEGWD